MKSALFAIALMSAGAATAQTTSTTDMGPNMSTQSSGAAATDSRGIPVVSAPAVAPSGWNNPVGTGNPAPAAGAAPSMGAATDLPPCSRTVTDRCVQTYERGRSR